MDVLTNGLTHVLSLNVSFAKMTSNFKIDGPVIRKNSADTEFIHVRVLQSPIVSC